MEKTLTVTVDIEFESCSEEQIKELKKFFKVKTQKSLFESVGEAVENELQLTDFENAALYIASEEEPSNFHWTPRSARVRTAKF